MLKHIISAFLLLCATVAQAQTYEYRKVTSQSEIVAGGVYVMVAPDASSFTYAGAFSSGKFTSINPAGTVPDSFSAADAGEIILEEEEGENIYRIKTQGNKYLQFTSSNNLVASDLDTDRNYQYKWEIIFNEESPYYVTIKKATGGNNCFRFHSSHFSFVDPKNGSGITLYKRVTTTPPAQDETVSISECGYATLCSDVALDFTGSGVEAYTGSISGDKLLLTKVDKVPAGAGVILYKENGGSATISAADGEVTALENNVLRGTTEAKTVRAGEKIYVLQNVDGEAAFCQVKQDTTLAKGKAYLDLSDSPVSAAKLTVAFSTPTSITAIQSTPNHTAHTLSGQRVSTAYRGIVVRDGKKIIQR